MELVVVHANIIWHTPRLS